MGIDLGRDILIILNYQREIPPFMITEIKVAQDRFDEVFYVTPLMYRDNSSSVNYPNVKVIQGSKKDSILNLIILPLSFLNGRVLKEIVKAIRWKRISKEFIKSFLQLLGASTFLMREAEKFIKKNKSNNLYILSAYMGAEAYAAARLKEKFNYVYTTALAHSFEVNPERDKNVDLHMNSFIHKYIDNINFISNSVYENYFNYVIRKYNLSTQNITCIHLGCVKLIDTLSTPSEDGILRIASCSTVNQNKQLHRLLHIIASWRNGTLIWTHIGDGPDFANLNKEAERIMKKNPKVIVKLLGYQSNVDVHKFYAENSVDLFINISQIEGLPVSLMECMAYGIPAIATDVGGNKEIANSKTGFLISSNFNDKMLLDILEKYFQLKPEIKLVYRENAFNQWKTNFNGRRNINDLFSILLRKRDSVN